MNKELMFSSKSSEWETPDDLFRILNMEFNFRVDLAATALNKKCKTYLSKEEDSLLQNWSELSSDYMWLNPPYGRGLYEWVQKCYLENKKGAKIVLLVPARTDVRWFHDFLYKKHEIRFLKGRLKFGDSKNSAPFPSMLVIFK